MSCATSPNSLRETAMVLKLLTVTGTVRLRFIHISEVSSIFARCDLLLAQLLTLLRRIDCERTSLPIAIPEAGKLILEMLQSSPNINHLP